VFGPVCYPYFLIMSSLVLTFRYGFQHSAELEGTKNTSISIFLLSQNSWLTHVTLPYQTLSVFLSPLI
jgi:peptidoglycan/LPS O-acetylase OafA/YrhL